jgi:3-hydroxyisobutyrate dehydrogenase-like beta-hydroxyacid dehydrogenase
LFLVMAKSWPACSVATDVKDERMVSVWYDVRDAQILQHLKDLDIILKYAHVAGQPLRLSAVHRDELAGGDGELDDTAIFRRYSGRSCSRG